MKTKMPKQLRAVYYLAMYQEKWQSKDIEALVYMAELLGKIVPPAIPFPTKITRERKDRLFDIAVEELYK
jgi:hypothetical protein